MKLGAVAFHRPRLAIGLLFSRAHESTALTHPGQVWLGAGSFETMSCAEQFRMLRD